MILQMDSISKIITGFFDLLVLPFGRTHHTLALVWLSLLTGVGMAYVFKLTSNQKKIKRAKDRFKSYILEMRIYQDDLGAVIRAFFRALIANFGYLAQTLRPLLVLIVPVVIIFMQLDERYARGHMPVGSTSLLTVGLESGTDPFEKNLDLQCSEGVSIDAGPVRIHETNEIDWRLRIISPGTHTVSVTVDGHSYEAPVIAEPLHQMVGHKRSASSIIEAFLHPALPPIPKHSLITLVHLRYPGVSYPMLFWDVHWIVIFIIYSLIGAIVIKLLVGFEI